MNVDATAVPSPIVAAFARGTVRQTAVDANRDPAINNKSDAEGAGSNVGGIDGTDIEGGAGELGVETNSRKLSPQKFLDNQQACRGHKVDGRGRQ